MERSVNTLSAVKGLRESICESSIFQNFFLRVLFKIEYEDVVEIEAKHEAQEELEINLEDLENEFMIDEKESESDCGIADSRYESDSDNHAKVTSYSITRIEINTLDGTKDVHHILSLFIHFKSFFSS